MTLEQIAFLQSLPIDGSLKSLTLKEAAFAIELAREKLCFVCGHGGAFSPDPYYATITFEGRKALSRF